VHIASVTTLKKHLYDASISIKFFSFCLTKYVTVKTHSDYCVSRLFLFEDRPDKNNVRVELPRYFTILFFFFDRILPDEPT